MQLVWCFVGPTTSSRRGRSPSSSRRTARAATTASRLRVSRVEYCVCTPLAENIQSPDASYWLDDETPRICVPQELIEYVTARKPRLLG